ncbi:iron ABC transporter permease [Xanthobacteraceae bacterium Astr-EGSB]|uniref:ABC transporter permease n=1 Tax=Astrobacterium formosum TaxID=3069710 RepID=UPI0027B5CACB|nr:iron ABC transporter permease [Xanthobacteraceae bacterium Astr-EGSB]
MIRRLRPSTGIAWAVVSSILIAIMVFAVAWPVGRLFLGSIIDVATGRPSIAAYQAFIDSRTGLASLGNTLLLGIAVTAAALVLGTMLAVIVTRLDFPGRRVIAFLPIATLVIPDVVAAQAWIQLLGNNGLLTRQAGALGLSLPGFYGWFGMIWVMTLQQYAYVYLIAGAAVQKADASLEDAAASLGSAPRRVLRTVTLRLLVPALVMGALVVFAHAIDNFGIPAILGHRVPVLSVAAYDAFVNELGDEPLLQSSLASILLLLGVLVLLVQRQVVAMSDVRVPGRSAPRPMALRPGTAALTTIVAGAVVAATLVPVFVILVTSVTATSGPVVHYGSFSLDNWVALAPKIQPLLVNSLMLASAATAAGLVFVVLGAYVVVRIGGVFGLAVDLLTLLPLMVSGTVLGISLIQSYNTGPIVLTGTPVIMIMAYAARRVPLGLKAVAATLATIPESVEEASQSLGVPPFRTFAKVLVPLMLPGIAAAGVLIWVTTLSELSATIVLYYGGMSTLPIEIFQQVDSGRMGAASVLGVVLLAVIFVPLGIARGFFGVDPFRSA